MKKKEAIRVLKIYLSVYHPVMSNTETDAVHKGIKALKKCRKEKNHGK